MSSKQRKWVITRWTNGWQDDEPETVAFAATREEARSKLRAIKRRFYGGNPAGFEVSMTGRWAELPSKGLAAALDAASVGAGSE